MENIHISYSDLEQLPWYQLEEFIDVYNEIQKEREKDKKGSGEGDWNDKYSDMQKKQDGMMKQARKQTGLENIMKNYGSDSFKMPSMPSFKPPKF